MQNYINNFIRPKVQGDGGEILFDSFDGDTLTVIMKGECSKCLIVERCIAWIESEIMRDIGEKVRIEVQKKKPFFWDKD